MDCQSNVWFRAVNFFLHEHLVLAMYQRYNIQDAAYLGNGTIQRGLILILHAYIVVHETSDRAGHDQLSEKNII